jgi:hypothetical protein
MSIWIYVVMRKQGRYRVRRKVVTKFGNGDALPIKKNPYRVHYALREEMKRQLDEMMVKGVITPCAGPVTLVPNKSPDGTSRYRFCTNFRGLNSVTITPVYPIPDIKGNISLMAGSSYSPCWILRMKIGTFLSKSMIGLRPGL